MYKTNPSGGTGIFVRSVKNEAEMDQVYRLTYENYVRREICGVKQERKLIHNCKHEHDPNTHVLVACEGNHLIGTLSISMARCVEDIYNYEIFKEDLQNEAAETADAGSFSGWRMATLDRGPKGRIVSLALMVRAMSLVLTQDAPFGYMCFRKEDLPFYERVSPGGKVIGIRRKNTNTVDVELCMWRCHLSLDDYWKARQLSERLLARAG